MIKILKSFPLPITVLKIDSPLLIIKQGFYVEAPVSDVYSYLRVIDLRDGYTEPQHTSIVRKLEEHSIPVKGKNVMQLERR